jgi:hypothetical protein
MQSACSKTPSVDRFTKRNQELSCTLCGIFMVKIWDIVVFFISDHHKSSYISSQFIALLSTYRRKKCQIVGLKLISGKTERRSETSRRSSFEVKIRGMGGGESSDALTKAIRSNLRQLFDGKRSKHLKKEI